MATLHSRSDLRAATATLGGIIVARSNLQFSADTLVCEEEAGYELFRAFRDRIRRIEAAESAEEIVWKLVQQ